MRVASMTAGDIVRRARRMMSLSQQELADRMGVHQSLISAYECGQRDPGVGTLERILEAAGLRLTWQLTHRGSGSSGHGGSGSSGLGASGIARAGMTGPIGRRLLEHRSEILEILAERGLSDPLVVGDVADGSETTRSRLFIVVTREPAPTHDASGAPVSLLTQLMPMLSSQVASASSAVRTCR